MADMVVAFVMNRDGRCSVVRAIFAAKWKRWNIVYKVRAV
jgi:hypothetical protein